MAVGVTQEPAQRNASSNRRKSVKNTLYYLAAIVLLCTMSLPAKAQSPKDLEEGTPRSSGKYQIKNEPLLCVIVDWNGGTYSVAGYVDKEGDFYAKYVGKQVGDKWVVVWSYTGGV